MIILQINPIPLTCPLMHPPAAAWQHRYNPCPSLRYTRTRTTTTSAHHSERSIPVLCTRSSTLVGLWMVNRFLLQWRWLLWCRHGFVSLGPWDCWVEWPVHHVDCAGEEKKEKGVRDWNFDGILFLLFGCFQTEDIRQWWFCKSIWILFTLGAYSIKDIP